MEQRSPHLLPADGTLKLHKPVSHSRVMTASHSSAQKREGVATVPVSWNLTLLFHCRTSEEPAEKPSFSGTSGERPALQETFCLNLTPDGSQEGNQKDCEECFTVGLVFSPLISAYFYGPKPFTLITLTIKKSSIRASFSFAKITKSNEANEIKINKAVRNTDL